LLDRLSPQNSGDSHRYLLIFILLLMAVNLFLFLPSMSGDFIWDDKYFISENSDLLGAHFLADFWRSPFGGFSGTDENSLKFDRGRQFFRPLASLSYWLDFKLWGLNVAAFHLTNILLQTVNSILLLLILLQVGFGRAPAFAGAVLFSVFPAHFENVAWISGRTDLLAFLFGALSVLCFLSYLVKNSRLSLAVSALFFLGGLLAKETVLFLPGIYMAVLWRRRDKTQDFLMGTWPFLAGVLIWFALRRMAFGSSSLSLSGRSVSDFLASVGFYVFRTVFPLDLSISVDSAPVFDNQAYVIFGALLTALFAASSVILVLRKSRRVDPFLFLFIYFLLLLPSVAVIFSSLSISLLAWRFLYIPSAVFVAALAYVLMQKVRPRVVGYALVGLLTIGYAAELYPKSKLFGKDDTQFWLGIRDIEREDLIARFNIAIKTLPQNEKRALEIFDQILAAIEHPLHSMWQTRIYEELAIYYAFQRNFAKAEYYFGELSRKPGGQSLHSTFNYSYYLAFAGKREEGERIVLDLIGRYPQNHFVLTRAAKFYLIVEDYRRAASLYGRDYELFRNEQTKVLLDQLQPLLRPGQ
jgi:hypothetical protein